MDTSNLRTQLIENDNEIVRLRDQLSQLQIRYDALRFARGDQSVEHISTDDVTRNVVAQTLSMGKTLK